MRVQDSINLKHEGTTKEGVNSSCHFDRHHEHSSCDCTDNIKLLMAKLVTGYSTRVPLLCHYFRDTSCTNIFQKTSYNHCKDHSKSKETYKDNHCSSCMRSILSIVLLSIDLFWLYNFKWSSSNNTTAEKNYFYFSAESS